MFVYICIFVLGVLWLCLGLIILYLFGKYSDLIKEYQKLENFYHDVEDILSDVYQIIDENGVIITEFQK